jgi:hypothetical protein
MAEAVALSIAPEELQETAQWLQFFSDEWMEETPLAINTHSVDDGHGLGGPAFNPDFIRWLGPICKCNDCIQAAKRGPRNGDSRIRTTRAFRKLRKVAPREFDVLYSLCVLHNSINGTADFLTKRAIRLNYPQRYDRLSVILLSMSGVDKLRSYYGLPHERQ